MPVGTRRNPGSEEDAPAVDHNVEAFNQMLDEFLGIKEGHPAKVALENDGITTVEDLTACPDDYIMGLSQTVAYKDSAGNDAEKQVLIQYVKRILLLWLKHFIIMLTREANGWLSPDDLDSIEKVRFDTFRTGHSEIPKLPALSQPAPVPSSQHAAAPHTTPAMDFKKGIKWDVTHYPILKDNRFLIGSNLSS